ncbi:hypothetical protein Ahy_B04g071144 [Arachis hypogaea]|uniref:non-specific serine/threonine protein kinase n=1 Tax=Arachis hypogaea TaxID=3818 RepID=A0A444ZK48_ARAHY|nr:hypothetical protein Ahy_B04g071144 [Arachis hypogaea]
MLDHNHFSGHIPVEIGFLGNLERLIIELAGNQFSGPIPTSITTAFGLQEVDFSINNFVGQVPNLGSLRNLSVLDLGTNDFGGNSSINEWEFIKSLINCSKLQEFGFEYNNFVGHLPNFIGNLSTKISQLAFGGNQISEQIPTELGNLVNLISLTMENNHLTESIPTSFGNFQKLQYLDMNSNKFSGEIPAIIGNLSQLSELDLSHNMLNGNIPSAIGNCKRLQSLDFSYNNLSGIIPSQVFEIPSLSILLNISHNSLSGSLPSEIGLLKSIGTLDVSENHLSNKIPEAIGECESLEYLYLQGNSFHGIIPPSLASLKGLQHLDLSQNQLSGTIPQELQNISVLVYFNASFNMLEGEVPMNGVFRNTTEVSLSGNRKLCGGIASLRLPPCPSKATKKRKHHGFKIWMIVIIPSSVSIENSTLSKIIFMLECSIDSGSSPSTLTNLVMSQVADALGYTFIIVPNPNYIHVSTVATPSPSAQQSTDSTMPPLGDGHRGAEILSRFVPNNNACTQEMTNMNFIWDKVHDIIVRKIYDYRMGRRL